MSKFDELYHKLLETMVAGGESSILAPNNGEHGNQIGGDQDWYARNNMTRQCVIGSKKRKYQKRKLSNTL